ncbi:hypothetical protein EDD18DRAFT_1203970 [Armillaria luteobubalina]|uniref:Uncharacterized protein n=1 Tax=Armillaria luteobubalina TaxID=153913 RepID=A0AA39PC87_9AGAR|nr:hypothetical protein EDD18DRAFT_1203970 [Armillaria luteobubalina]
MVLVISKVGLTLSSFYSVPFTATAKVRRPLWMANQLRGPNPPMYLAGKAGVRCCDVGDVVWHCWGLRRSRADGMAKLALSSSTPMGRPVTCGCIHDRSVHRDGRGHARLRCPSSCAGSLCHLPVRDVGPGVSGAKEHCVLSTPPYRGGVVPRGRLLGATAHTREHQEPVYRLGRPQGYTACHPGSRVSATPSRRGVQAVHGSVRLV